MPVLHSQAKILSTALNTYILVSTQFAKIFHLKCENHGINNLNSKAGLHNYFNIILSFNNFVNGINANLCTNLTY